jgi:hypothetical protein
MVVRGNFPCKTPSARAGSLSNTSPELLRSMKQVPAPRRCADSNALLGKSCYEWKWICGDLQASEAKRLKVLDDENVRIERLDADQYSTTKHRGRGSEKRPTAGCRGMSARLVWDLRAARRSNCGTGADRNSHTDGSDTRASGDCQSCLDRATVTGAYTESQRPSKWWIAPPDGEFRS